MSVEKRGSLSEDQTSKKISEDNGVKLSELDSKIVTQIEHYFGDRNLMRDKFLKQKIKEDEGWVTLECLLTFNRLKNLSENAEVVMSALNKSVSQIIESDAKNMKVRRRTDVPLPEVKGNAYWENIQKKSAHMSNFPKTYTLEEIENLIHARSFKTEYIKMICGEKKKFTGDLNVQFQSEEILDSFVSQSLETPFEVNGEKITVMKLNDYMHQKNISHAKKSLEIKSKKTDRLTFLPGRIVKIEDVSPEANPEIIRNALDPLNKVDWVYFVKEKNECLVRFVEANVAESVVSALLDSSLTVCGKTSKVSALTGDEELESWNKLLPHNFSKIQPDVKKQGRRDGNINKRAFKPFGKHKYFEDDTEEKEDLENIADIPNKKLAISKND